MMEESGGCSARRGGRAVVVESITPVRRQMIFAMIFKK